MTAKIRVMIVDDAVVVRRMLTDLLAADPELEVVGAAPNGRIALTKIPQLNPDVMILDIEMPEMDGLETVAELRKTNQRLPVIMFSTLTERGASATLDALARGANDYVTKPANVGSVTLAMQRIRDELIPKIKQFRGRMAAPAAPARPALQPPARPGLRPPARPGLQPPARPGLQPPARPGLQRPERPGTLAPARAVAPAGGQPRSSGVIEAVGIVASTGGPNALAELLPALPGDLGVPVLIVQHMPPVFTSLLASRLDGQSKLTVREGAAGEPIGAGTAWLAPGGFHMVLKRDSGQVKLDTNTDPPENSCRPAGDVLLRSMAQIWGGRMLIVMLTGMGTDGLRGAEQARGLGAQVIAQDETSSVVWGIPGAVVKAGLTDRVLPLAEIAPEIAFRVGSGSGRSSAGGTTR